MTKNHISSIRINSFDELLKHEKEILQLIAKTHNGGNLFMIHPFMLLADIGVECSEQARTEIMSHLPYLSGLSPRPYNALKGSSEQQRVQFHIRSLSK